MGHPPSHVLILLLLPIQGSAAVVASLAAAVLLLSGITAPPAADAVTVEQLLFLEVRSGYNQGRPCVWITQLWLGIDSKQEQSIAILKEC